jgi:hypothetical protein
MRAQSYLVIRGFGCGDGAAAGEIENVSHALQPLARKVIFEK